MGFTDMKILITGATGFIGSKLAAQLKASGHTVYGLTRSTNRPPTASIDKFFAWPAGQQPPREALEGVDAVVHLAGETVNGRWTPAKKARVLSSRVEGTRYLVAAMQAAGSRAQLVSASAVGFYGNRDDEELDEASAPGAGFLKDVCLAWEAEAAAASEAGIDVAILRLGIILGRDGGALPVMLRPFRLGIGGPMGSGKQWWPWVHEDDVTGIVQQVIEQKATGVFNVTSPQPARQAEFARALGKALHRPAVLPAPAFAVRLLLGEFADEVLFSKRVLPKRVLASGYGFKYSELDAALADLLRR